YMLGYKPDDPKPERTREAFEAFRQRHLDAEAEIDDPEASIVCTFLRHWDPALSADHSTLAELATGFGVFRLRATDHYVHGRTAVRSWWDRQVRGGAATDGEVMGQWLITGERSPIARLHEPKIKG